MNIALDRYLITKKSRPLLVAELSCNHCGSLILAKKIIKEAKMQGAEKKFGYTRYRASTLIKMR